MKFLVVPFYLALPWGADIWNTHKAQAVAQSRCDEFAKGMPIPLHPGSIAVLEASLPKDFKFITTFESSRGNDWAEDELKNVFDKVWTERTAGYPTSSLTLVTEGGPILCNSFENIDACLDKHAGSADVYRFTNTEVRFREFPRDLPVQYIAMRTRLWQMVNGEATVIAMWSSLRFSKNVAWSIFTLWSEPLLYECSTDDQSYKEWITTNLIGEAR